MNDSSSDDDATPPQTSASQSAAEHAISTPAAHTPSRANHVGYGVALATLYPATGSSPSSTATMKPHLYAKHSNKMAETRKSKLIRRNTLSDAANHGESTMLFRAQKKPTMSSELTENLMENAFRTSLSALSPGNQPFSLIIMIIIYLTLNTAQPK